MVGHKQLCRGGGADQGRGERLGSGRAHGGDICEWGKGEKKKRNRLGEENLPTTRGVAATAVGYGVRRGVCEWPEKGVQEGEGER